MSFQVANVKGESFSVEVRLEGIDETNSEFVRDASLFELIVRPAIVAGEGFFEDTLPDIPNVELYVSTPHASLFHGSASELNWARSELCSYLQESAETIVRVLDELEKV